jgi:hypothetical protein
MKINQGFAASGRGYVRAVFSRRMRGYALPVDLVRVHLRATNSAGMARRLRAAFADYLVSEVWSDNRPEHNLGVDTYCCTSKDFMCDVRYSLGAGGPIDAPPYIAAGGMYAGEVMSLGQAVRRVAL